MLLLSVSLHIQHNYHDSREETHCLAAGGLGRHVPVAHREEGDGHEPQGRVHFTRHFDGFPAGKKCSRYEIVPELMGLVTLSHKTSVGYSCVQLEFPCDLLPTVNILAAPDWQFDQGVVTCAVLSEAHSN